MFSKTHTKYIQSLQHKKFRDELNLFFAEGTKVVTELLDSRVFICKEIYALQNWVTEHEKFLQAFTIGDIIVVKDFELEKISALANAHHVLAVFEKRDSSNNANIQGKVSLCLDTIQDPGNLGTIIRIADWFAIENIFCSAGCADMYSPKVVQSTMGSLSRVNVIYTDLKKLLNETPITAYAADMHGTDVRMLGKLKEGIIIIGNEGKGISDDVLHFAKEKITIPKLGDAESLNAAVAAGIILSHVV